MLRRSKQKSQGIWTDPEGLRHWVRTKTKLSDLLTLLNCTLSEPEIAEQCLRIQWWGLYWDYNASVISLFLKIFKRPISTQLGKKKKKAYICAFILYYYIKYVGICTCCLFFSHFIIQRLLICLGVNIVLRTSQGYLGPCASGLGL